MPTWTKGFGGRLALIALGGLAIRLAYTLIIARTTGGVGDYFFYDTSANLLAQGEGFVDPFTLASGDPSPTAEHPPLWSMVLSVTSYLGGTGFLAHKLTGVLVGTLTILPVGLLARRAAGERAGLIAAGIAAVYPTFVAADGSLMSETLYGLLVALSMVAAYRVIDGGGGAWWAALGAFIGLAALTRTEALLLIPLLALPVALRSGAGARDRGLRFAAVCLAAAVVIAPWTIRNWVQFDEPVLISINGAAVLAGANCDGTYRGEDTGLWRVDCAGRDNRLTQVEQEDQWRRKGLDYAGDNLGRLPAVAGVRVLRVWDLWQPVRATLSEGRNRNVQGAGTGMYYLLAPLAIWGAVLLRRRRETLIPFAAPVAMVTLAAMAGYGIPRFRHAAEIAIVVLAAVALDRLARRRRQGAAA